MTRSQRGRANRSAGVRFERAVATKLREAGFECRRVLEFDGFSHGNDLQVAPGGTCHWLPVALQCKATRNRLDGLRGLDQAQAGNPNAALWVCIHSFRAPGRRPQLRILTRDGATTKLDVTWDALVAKLKSLANSG